MVRSILVPLDGSSFAEHALPMALTLARRAKADLSLVLVHVPLAAIYAETRHGLETAYDPFLKKQEQDYLASVAQRVQKAANFRVRTLFAEGLITESIQKEVKAANADLIVMASHGRGAFKRFWLGSVADEMIRHAATPVLVVKPRTGLPDLGEETPLRQILIPLDGSALGEQAIEPATALGGLAEAHYTLLRTIKPALPLAIDYLQAPMTPEYQELFQKVQNLHQQEVKHAEEYVQGVSQRLAQRALRAETRVVSAEQPAAAILEEASYAGANLIALATHGRGGLGRLWLGSVADKVVRASALPVLVCRAR